MNFITLQCELCNISNEYKYRPNTKLIVVKYEQTYFITVHPPKVDLDPGPYTDILAAFAGVIIAVLLVILILWYYRLELRLYILKNRNPKKYEIYIHCFIFSWRPF